MAIDSTDQVGSASQVPSSRLAAFLRADATGLLRSRWFILIAAFATRIYAAGLASFSPRMWEASHIAASLVAGQGFSSPFGVPTGPTAFLPPGLPMLIAAVFALFGSYSATSTHVLLVLQCAASAAVVLPVIALGKTSRYAGSAYLAAWIWALHPTFANISSLVIWDTSLTVLLMAVAVVLARKLRGESRWTRWAAFGLLWAVATLWNAALVLAFAGLLAWAVKPQIRDVRVLSRSACALVVFLALLMPWVVRNNLVLHALVPLRDNFALEFWNGNRNFGNYNPFDHPGSSAVELARYRAVGEIAYMAEKKQLALDQFRAAPANFVALSLRRVIAYWEGAEWGQIAWLSLPFVFLAPLGFALLDPSERWLYAIPLLIFPLPYYVTHIQLRFREVLDPLLVILASQAMLWAFERIRRPRLAARRQPDLAEIGNVAAPAFAQFSGPAPRTAVIIGAGPAGLTAAYELLTRTSIKPIILEKNDCIGGLARTVEYKGNRMDIGPHRFFSKSERVMNWWLHHMPLQEDASDSSPQRMIACQRQTRIYFLRKFFEYPIRLSLDTLTKLGWWRDLRIGFSYLRSSLFPIRRVVNLEHFFINRFGRELYRTFFKSYTEKVWGVSCNEISAEWGEQRIKGLSITKAVTHVLKKAWPFKGDGLAQRNTETSLIEQFLYPKGGAGKMWETVARRVLEMGGEIHTSCDVQRLEMRDGRLSAVIARTAQGAQRTFAGDLFFSTMPVQELVRALGEHVPAAVRQVSDGLMYRDLINVGLLVKKMTVNDGRLIADNWIYLQEGDVHAGRMQIFNNWGPHMVASPDTVWLGIEYFCYEGDAHWTRSDAELAQLATAELSKIGLIDAGDVLDFHILRAPKCYPAYFGTYDRFQEIRNYVDGIQNLFLLGRNGMHKYNNQDHSMLTAMVAVDNIAAGCYEKASVWDVNTEQEYHEAKRETARRIDTGKAAVATSQA